MAPTPEDLELAPTPLLRAELERRERYWSAGVCWHCWTPLWSTHHDCAVAEAVRAEQKERGIADEESFRLDGERMWRRIDQSRAKGAER